MKKPSADYSKAVWKRARQMFADDQFTREVLGEYCLTSWLKAATRSLAARQKERE